ncbi:MAG: HNH endonuclease [Clostridium sp.]
MNQFLVPFNINVYDAIKAYEKLEEIDWTIRTKMNVGDEVYFYCSKPIQKILMTGIVTKVDVKFEEMIEDDEFYVEESSGKSNNGKKYVRIKKRELISEELINLLSFEKLRENGLKGNIQSTQMLDKNKELFEYINFNIKKYPYKNEQELDICEIEGKEIPYYMIRHERSNKNRMAAIKIHGTKCVCCGFDFELVYGDLGKGFIEVHHKNPVSNLEKEQEISPKKDLICLCSNCHRMIHRNRQKSISVEELRKIISGKRE